MLRRLMWSVVGLLMLPVGASTAQADAASPTAAQQPPAVTPLPTAVAPPPEGKGVPCGTAAVEGATGSVDLAAFGYVEEEFIVSGQANVYRYGPAGAVEVETAEVPYATRILVRRPESPRRFSGNVQVETTHPNFGQNVVWAQASEHILANGDAYVSITTRRTTGGFSAIEVMKSFDPVRYGPLQFPEDGLNWDVIGQVGRLLKTPIPANPLDGYDVERLYASGWSGGGALLLLYISDGFHGRARMPDGAPIFDGYLVGEPSGYPRINSTVPAIPTSDPHQQVQPRDVPAITLHTRPQEQFRRRPDGDQPSDRYRVYEVAGAAHADLRLTPGVLPDLPPVRGHVPGRWYRPAGLRPRDHPVPDAPSVQVDACQARCLGGSGRHPTTVAADRPRARRNSRARRARQPARRRPHDLHRRADRPLLHQ